MSVVDFQRLFLHSDNLRNDAQIGEAVASYLEIAKLAYQVGDSPIQARALHLAGVATAQFVESKESSNFRDAFKYFQEAETLYKRNNESIALGALYRDMAVTYDCARVYTQAEVYFEKSVAMLESTEAYVELAMTYDKFALHFHALGEQETAIRYIEKAFETFRQDKPHGFYNATVLLDKARILTKRGFFDQAYDVALESASWFEADHGESSFRYRLAQLYGLLAVLAARIGQDKQAKLCWRKFVNITTNMDPLARKYIKQELERLFD